MRRPNLAGRAATTGRCLLAGLALAVSASSSATLYTFDFNSLADNASNAAVQTYMRGSSPEPMYPDLVHRKPITAMAMSAGRLWVPIRSSGTSAALHFTFDFEARSASTPSRSIGKSSRWRYVFQWDLATARQPGPVPAEGPANANWPDFDLYVDGSSTAAFSRVAVATGINPNYPQAIGTSGTFNLAGAHFLDFVDWPATIAIDNLVINGCRDIRH